MVIASGIFWIMVGVLYILYQAFKEHPSETLTGVLVCTIMVGSVVLFLTIFDWLMEKSIALAAVFFIVVVGLFVYKVGGTMIRDAREKRKDLDEHIEWMEKVRSTMTEKDYEDYAKKSYRSYGASMNKDSIFYWKKEPYYSKIATAAEICRSIEMREQEDKGKGI